ncbi:MAG: hypothetical protein RLZZ200_1168 [Pseudomonadota bacterium]|jgi:outer membrane protein assembly factor BamB
MIRKEILPVIVALATAGLPAAPAVAATPTATIDLPAKAKWHRVTSLGLVLVGTDDALMLLDGEAGKVLWKRDDIKKTLSYNVREVEGQPIILVNDWSSLLGSKVSSQGLDFATGETKFTTDAEQGMNFGLYVSPDGAHILNIAQVATEGAGTYATLYDGLTGKKLWRTKITGMMGLTLHPAETGAFIVTRQDLSGHQDPLFDENTVYLPFQGLMALDRATGSVKWNVEYTTADKELKKAYAAPVIDGDTIFAAGKGLVYAIDKATGQVKWKTDKVSSGMFSAGAISQVLPAGDKLYVRLGGNFYNAPKKQFELKKPLGVMALDRATGNKDWDYKDAEEGITNLVLLKDQGVVMLSDAAHLTGLDLSSKGKATKKFDVPIEFKRKMSGGEVTATAVSAVSGFLTGGLSGALKASGNSISGKSRLDVPVALIPNGEGQVVVAGKQHLMKFDPVGQKIAWSTYYAAPGSSGLGVAAMSALTLAAAAGQGAYYWSGNTSSYNTYNSNGMQQQFGSLGNYAAKRYSASKQARDYAYVLTNVTEGKDSGVGLMAISYSTGEPGAQVLLKDKEPEYEVDDVAGRLFYFTDKKQVQVFNLK